MVLPRWGGASWFDKRSEAGDLESMGVEECLLESRDISVGEPWTKVALPELPRQPGTVTVTCPLNSFVSLSTS
jgi:hypothetical protein